MISAVHISTGKGIVEVHTVGELAQHCSYIQCINGRQADASLHHLPIAGIVDLHVTADRNGYRARSDFKNHVRICSFIPKHRFLDDAEALEETRR
jgi:hypothetical protein